MKLRKARSFVNRVAGDGGLRLVVRKAYGIFRREGVAGIRSRIAWLRAGAPGVIDPVLYAEWVRRYDQVDDATRAAIRERIAGFANPPLISVVMPVYNPDPAWETLINGPTSEVAGEMASNFLDDEANRRSIQ
ncbi:hypothetical protein [Burkholderia sp. 9777_1386]|uniref:hypothetical protein n=1 Tax=Burkholderia sp. 9777_1386 TaxID=2751183 RepID=UPI001E5BCD8D|nr:hypothetical protein [Burkholderia sp. 9777_1386]